MFNRYNFFQVGILGTTENSPKLILLEEPDQMIVEALYDGRTFFFGFEHDVTIS